MVPTGTDNFGAWRVRGFSTRYDSRVASGVVSGPAWSWQPHVPAATVGRPALADGVVDRTALVAGLSGSADGTLVVIRAPVGYGKTTTTALWDDADPRPFAWVRLDHLDDDPAHLVLHVATALDAACGISPEVLAFLRGPGRAPVTQLVPVLIEALERCGPAVLVLDDAHLVTGGAATEVLATVIDEAPSTVVIVLIGRQLPTLNVARRRTRRAVTEIGPDELKLTDAEAMKLFATLQVSDDTVSAVVDKCEGWASGVVLAALAMRHGSDARELTGRNELVADYLVEEVLSRLDASTTRFLEESSVLDRLSAPHLDVVLERDDSARMLAAIAQSGNLFLVSLDSERVSYRYHRLFGDLLRARLCDRDPGRYRSLARAMAELLDREGDVDGALLQAVAAGHRELSARLVQRDAVRLGFDGRAGVLARRLAQLDEQTFTSYADAAIARAWLGVTTGDAKEIQSSLIAAHRADRGESLADGTPSVAVAAALVGSLVGVGGVREVVHNADIVRAAGDYLVNPWWGAATTMKGAALSMMGQPAQARGLLESALPATENLPGFHAAALAHLALLDFDAGDVAAALERGAAAHTIADTHDLCDLVPMVVVYAVHAVISAHVGEIASARTAIARTEHLLHRLGALAARTALLGHVLLAWTGVLLDDLEVRSDHIHGADRARLREPHALGLIRRLERIRRLAAGNADGPPRRALTVAERRLLPYLATHLSLQQIAEHLVVSRETTKSQTTSIYRKLCVSSRSAAVAEARRLGLMDGGLALPHPNKVAPEEFQAIRATEQSGEMC